MSIVNLSTRRPNGQNTRTVVLLKTLVVVNTNGTTPFPSLLPVNNQLGASIGTWPFDGIRKWAPKQGALRS